MEYWRALWQNSTKNMMLAQELLDRTNANYLGLAAFHTQQALEMAVKSSVYYFGFDQFLRMKTVGEINDQILLEKDFSMLPGHPLKTHFPTGELALPPVAFIEYEIEKTLEKGTGYPELDRSMRDMRGTIRLLTSLVYYLAPPKDEKVEKAEIKNRKLELLKLSFHMDIHDPTLMNYLERLKAMTEPGGTVPSFLDSSLSFIRMAMQRFVKLAQSTGNDHLLKQYEHRAVEILEKSGLPREIYYYLRDDDITNYQAIINEMIAKNGIWPILIKLSSPQLEKLRITLEDDISKPRDRIRLIKSASVPRPMARIKFIWMSYVVALSYTMFFLYPHEEFGRYPEEIDGKSTEDLYLEHRSDLRSLIEKSEEGCKVFKALMGVVD